MKLRLAEKELSGVFNWILEGLDRLLSQKNFSKCKAIDNARTEYEKQSDSVQLFISANNLEKSADFYILISIIYSSYKYFCTQEGFKHLGKSKFIARLRHLKYNVNRLNVGNVLYVLGEIEPIVFFS